MTMRQYDKFLTIVLAIFLALIIYFASFSSLVYNLTFYNSLFDKTSVETNSARSLTKDLFAYFKNSNYSAPQIKTLTADENSHIRDVKIVINNSFTVFYILLIIFLVSLFFVKQKQKVFFYGAILGIIAPFIILIANFSFVFNIFHQIFFPQGNWIFPINSTLVSTYTFDFFKLFAAQILLQGEFISIVLVLFSLFFQKASRI